MSFSNLRELRTRSKLQKIYKKIKNIKNDKNENHQKPIIFEGFRQNGLKIRIQRNFLRILTPVKIVF